MRWFVACSSNAGSCEMDDIFEMSESWDCYEKVTPFQPTDDPDEWGTEFWFDDPFTAGRFADAALARVPDAWIIVGADPGSERDRDPITGQYSWGQRLHWNV